MTEINRNKFMLSIITCQTKKNPPTLMDTLSLIKLLRDQEEQSSQKKISIPPHIDPSISKKKRDITAEEALEFACWLVNANHLYDVALQTYDISLVLLVAKHTQKDPKEYLPYLKSLQELEPTLMKYTIQKDLKQYNLALIELSKVFSLLIYFRRILQNIVMRHWK